MKLLMIMDKCSMIQLALAAQSIFSNEVIKYPTKNYNQYKNCYDLHLFENFV